MYSKMFSDVYKVVAFDIETPSLAGEASFVSWCDGRQPHGVALKGPKDFTHWFIDTLLVKKYGGHILVAHYGLGFDYLRLRWELIAKAGYRGQFFAAKSMNNIRGVNLRKGKRWWMLRDSLNYFPHSLDEFCKAFAPECKKGHIDFERERFDPHKRRHVSYALNDSRILWVAVRNLNDTLTENFNVNIFEALTLPGIALKCIKKLSKDNGFLPMEKLNDRFEKIVRSSYHGGLTCAWKVGTFTNLIYYDVRSAYPKIMRDYPLPAGQPVLTFNAPRKDVDDLIFASVDIGAEFPFLVSMDKKGKARHRGRVTGWWWGFELDLQARLGSPIKKWAWLRFSLHDDRHRSFINMCERVRAQDYGGGIGKLVKRFQNSIYGKYGAQSIEHEIKLDINQPAGIASPLMTHDGRDIEALWICTKTRLEWTMVHWASYITARCRWLTMSYLLRIPAEDWVYSDTDSFIVPDKYKGVYRNDVGEHYGQLKIEKRINFKNKQAMELEIRAPKTYRIKSGQGYKGKYTAKGIPKRVMVEAWKQGKVIFDASNSLGVILRGRFKKGERYRHEVKRSLSNPYSVAHGRYIKGLWTADLIGASVDFPGADLLAPIMSKILRQIHKEEKSL